MGYTTEQQLVNAFGFDEIRVLSNLNEPNAPAINSQRIAEVIGNAHGIVNGYVGVRNMLPISSPAAVAILEPHEAAIARYLLDLNRPREDVRKRFEDSIGWLKELASGKVFLGDDVSPRSTSTTADLPSVPKDVAPPIATYRASSPIFTPRLTREIW